MKWKVWLTDNTEFIGIRGFKESARECKGFHRFKVIESTMYPVNKVIVVRIESISRMVEA